MQWATLAFSLPSTFSNMACWPPTHWPPHLLSTVPCRCSRAKQADGHRELTGYKSSRSFQEAVSRRAVREGYEGVGLEHSWKHRRTYVHDEIFSRVTHLPWLQLRLGSNSLRCHKSTGLGARLFWVWIPNLPLFSRVTFVEEDLFGTLVSTSIHRGQLHLLCGIVRSK